MRTSVRGRVVHNRFSELKAAALAELSDHVQDTGEQVKEGAVARSREDRPHMKTRWQIHKASPWHVVVFNDSPIVNLHEKGTRHMSAQPMAVPAVEAARAGWVAGLRRIL